MKKLRYLSPTSMMKFYDDRNEFYLNYLSDNRPPRIPQTKPMSIGSAFDAYVKSYLVKGLFDDPNRFVFEVMFEQMVEPQNRGWARQQGLHVFEQYKESGALESLMLELDKAIEDPQFELTVEGNVSYESCVEEIPVLGKPDVFFKTKSGTHVVYDWKVNGYCSSRMKTPAKGYLELWDGRKDWIRKGYHKECQPMVHGDVRINRGTPFELVDEKWATQCAMYGWVLGEPIGSNFVIGIDQLCGCGEGDYGNLRIAMHRGVCSTIWQQELVKKLEYVWQCSKEPGTVFDGLMDERTSRHHCEALDGVCKIYESNDPRDKWIQNMRG